MKHVQLSIEDQLAIQDLVHRFAHYSDYEEWDKLRALYTDDVTSATIGQEHVNKGIDAQIEHARHSSSLTDGKNRHFYFNLFIDSSQHETKAQYYVMNVNANSKPLEAQIVVTGRMTDTVIKTDDGWKIAHRLFAPDQRFDISW